MFDHGALRRAKESIIKRGNFCKRPRMWLQRVMVERLVKWCSGRGQLYNRYGTLYLLTYAFLLRLPSEALPAVAGKSQGQASLYIEGETLVLELLRRKNKPSGSKLVRTCWCRESKVSPAVLQSGGCASHAMVTGHLSGARHRAGARRL